MPMNEWTGGSACALQAALRLSNEGFAAHLGIAVRTVAFWHQKPATRPRSEMQQLLDTALEHASTEARARFSQRNGDAPANTSSSSKPGEAQLRLIHDGNITAALDWLDRHSGHNPGWGRAAVANRLAETDAHDIQDRATRRGQVSQRDLATALRAYYDSANAAGHGTYAARFGEHTVLTSVLTRSEWLDLDCPLATEQDRLRTTSASATASKAFDDEAADHAVSRLAEALTTSTRMINNPIYALTSADIHRGVVRGSVGIAHYVEYALTMDLLEGELIDALAAGDPTSPGQLPLRDRHLPDLASVLDVGSRMCAGGVLALCAFARPADPLRGDADYLLLVQERSGHVLNAARRLAVIPKGFHQPLTDVRADAQLGMTLMREMEEELFGRGELDNTIGQQRRADPMHPSRLSEPMRYLREAPGRMRLECTAFGLNLVSGNFELASLIVIEDEEFWSRYGGVVEANWESSALRRYSSRDDDLLSELINDVAWSNEGLFAMTQGLHRLAELGGHRVRLPPITWEIRS
jgi:hypothetical protein